MLVAKGYVDDFAIILPHLRWLLVLQFRPMLLLRDLQCCEYCLYQWSKTNICSCNPDHLFRKNTTLKMHLHVVRLGPLIVRSPLPRGRISHLSALCIVVCHNADVRLGSRALFHSRKVPKSGTIQFTPNTLFSWNKNPFFLTWSTSSLNQTWK